MKYIAIIGLGLVLLLTICGVVLWANMPTAKLTVHAVRPIGPNICEFATTNSGRAPADWSAEVRYKNVEGAPLFNGVSGAEDRDVKLPAGEHTTVNIWLPMDSPCLWRAEVSYQSPMNSLERTLSSWLQPVPALGRLLPNSGQRFVYDVWHTGTNVTTAR